MLTEEPRPRSFDHLRVNVMDPGHVAELHQPVGRQRAIGGRVAEPVEAAAGDLEAQQPLVAEVDVLPGRRLDLGHALLRAAEVVQRQHVRIRRRGGLLEAAVRPLENRLQPIDKLAEG